MTYQPPLRDRVVSRVIGFAFRFASEECRSFARTVENFGLAEVKRHADALQLLIDERSEATHSSAPLPGSGSQAQAWGYVDSLPDG